MKKPLKIILLILTVVISGGITAFYLVNISQPWYTLTNVDNYVADIGINSELVLYNETLIFGNDKSELKFFDLSSDEPFVPTASLNLSVPANNRFEIVEEMLYTVYGSAFYILNITDQMDHGIVGNYTGTLFFDDFYLDGDIVYIASLEELLILDISVPENITLLYQRSLFYGQHGITLHNNLLYITETMAGLKIMNVTDPTSPVSVYQISYYENYVAFVDAREVFVTDNLLLIMDDIDGLVIFNITRPGQYDYLSSTWAVGESTGFIVVDNFVYAGGIYGLKLIDISNPLKPFALGAVEEHRKVFALVVYESDPYILHGQGLSLYLLEPGVGPNPVRKEIAIEAITGFLGIIAYITIGIILVSVVKRSKVL
ncbi:MAG: LVIVD repeat-containing protein [Promethearchaeota archaeon]